MPVVAVVDTSVLVSAFLNPVGFPARVLVAAKKRQFTLVTSAPLLEELREVLSRPRLMRVRNTTLLTLMLLSRALLMLPAKCPSLVPCNCAVTLMTMSCWKLPSSAVATRIVSRDEDITRDQELLAQLKKRRIKAVTVSRFLAELEE